MIEDAELLRQFAEEKAEAAFAELVRRRIGMVYAVARRHTRDAQQAEEVTQSVFCDLARKAGRLAGRPVLLGWLYRSAQFAASDVRRAERRRETYAEEIAFMQRIARECPEPDWDQIRPILDDLLNGMSDTDRDAILLRFYEGRAFGEIAAALRLTENAARMRVERALQKMNRALARRGVTSTAGALGLALGHAAGAVPPAALAAKVTGAALWGASTGAFVSGALLGFLMNKFTVGLGAVVAFALLAVTFGQVRTATRVRAEIAQQRNERDLLRAAVMRTEQGVGDRRPKRLVAGEGSPVLEAMPEMFLAESDLAQLDNTYAGLFRRLRLPEEKVEWLRRLLIRRESGERAANRFAREHGARDLSIAEYQELYAIWNQPVTAQIEALLGEKDYAYFKSYTQNLAHRRHFDKAAELLAPTREPLRDEQIDQLVAWTAEVVEQRYATAGFEKRPKIPDEVMARATAILSPLQLEKVDVVKKSEDAVLRLLAMNRAAAEQGLLNLDQDSAKHYPSRDAKVTGRP